MSLYERTYERTDDDAYLDRIAKRELRKLGYELDDIVRDYGDYFSKDDIKVLIKFLSRKDKIDKKMSDVENLIYDLDMLKIKFSEYRNDPFCEMLERLQ
ncbi:hypothetical protein [Campylobacter hyointestinalis]|uniref:hypothetical protein n=1 Tax=Campylobacter hyointestinalis TaxID=198 RepID=UPI000DCC79CA|nr:hypothetical protein [Campylobacter hyointestinalis]RAZ38029.1 hypothetical protein CHL9426_07080 [Campylobacter hyointestinalis subsp. lawsonii]RAZ54666.1 hypothetical protein CHL10074_06760 [Campylobacter hyointestinalis subsp. lawsonii]RAZ63350.1 hypothetical protein CHL9767_06865 [Campylobacter hyointestinalis subsp. lawsonii]